MQEMLANPAVQGGLAPFVAALIVAALLAPIRLGGLAVVAAFATAVYFIAGFTFSPLTATRKIILLGFAAPLAGIVIDFALRPTRFEAGMLALAGAGAAGLALGAGTGAAAILGASLTYGLYGFAVAAGSGAFLLVQMIIGRKTHAGATLMLAATVVTMLLAAATMILAQLPWYAVLALAFVPVAASLPLRAGAPIWLQAVLLSFLGLVVAGIACALAWNAGA